MVLLVTNVFGISPLLVWREMCWKRLKFATPTPLRAIWHTRFISLWALVSRSPISMKLKSFSLKTKLSLNTIFHPISEEMHHWVSFFQWLYRILYSKSFLVLMPLEAFDIFISQKKWVKITGLNFIHTSWVSYRKNLR